jgi:single-strand DNA-binding protein
MVNHVILMGRLVRDPELRVTPGGDSVCNFALAINEKTTKNGQRQDQTIFVDCTCWKKQAEAVGQWKHKGDLVLVEGKLALHEWVDKQTQQKRSKLTITAFTVQFMDQKSQQGQQDQAPDEAMSERW